MSKRNVDWSTHFGLFRVLAALQQNLYDHRTTLGGPTKFAVQKSTPKVEHLPDCGNDQIGMLFGNGTGFVSVS